MKKYILPVLIVIFTATTVIIFLNENKPRNLEKYIFETDNLSEEIRRVNIFDNSTTINKNIKKDDSLFLPIITLLTDMEIKKSNSKFNYTEGYDLMIIHNKKFYSIHINENGLLNAEDKIYKVQNDETVKELFNILKNSTQ